LNGWKKNETLEDLTGGNFDHKRTTPAYRKALKYSSTARREGKSDEDRKGTDIHCGQETWLERLRIIYPEQHIEVGIKTTASKSIEEGSRSQNRKAEISTEKALSNHTKRIILQEIDGTSSGERRAKFFSGVLDGGGGGGGVGGGGGGG